MKVFRACLTLGFVVSSGMAQLCEGANADSLELNQEDLRITIHVFNYARIARDELIQAEREVDEHPRPSRGESNLVRLCRFN